MAEAIENKTTEQGEAAGTPAAEPENKTPETPKTFSEDYVHALRAENKNYRISSKNYEKALRKVLGLEDGAEIGNVDEKVNGFLTAKQQEVEAAKNEVNKYIISAELAKLTGDSYNNKLVNKLLDTSGVKVENNTVTGLKEALEALEKEYPEIRKKKTQMAAGTGSDTLGGNNSDTAAFRKALGLEK